ncbi:sarcosine oxidase subunit delta [Marivibrio halodurans]|uniref:Sarcosine oxidase subunit delta n=1 Tax=Marivibrio halodurans TaxID=2039722 RepID=A0A8J7V220_9PROT|nr:sarcosine oxidase subunit delta [Marivibrio halodurans]MBP5856407.1 sarcosine oxidase subunit delta [Marivibrio halodurans]
MFRIECPWCGTRDMVEFTYVGDGTLTRPALGARTGHFEHVYLRANPKGTHVELWHHVAGCRQHVAVKRDTLTHEILATGGPGEVTAARDDVPKGAAKGETGGMA